jgi:hypothetical protein
MLYVQSSRKVFDIRNSRHGTVAQSDKGYAMSILCVSVVKDVVLLYKVPCEV